MEQLVFDFFEACELRPVEIRKGVWQVNVGDALMKELDGWRAQGRLLQFTFDQDLAEIYGADLICPGSYRLNTILQVTRRQAILSQIHIPHHFFHEPSIRRKILGGFRGSKKAYVVNSFLRYGQYLQLEILAETRGLKKESIHSVVVNLSSGEVLKFPIPPHLLKPGGVAAELKRKRACSFKQAFINATTHLSHRIEESDQSWAEQSLEKLAADEEKLRGFFQESQDSEQFRTKKKDLRRRLEPILRMDAIRGATVWVPLFCYRLMVVDAKGKEKGHDLSYDPLGNLHD